MGPEDQRNFINIITAEINAIQVEAFQQAPVMAATSAELNQGYDKEWASRNIHAELTYTRSEEKIRALKAARDFISGCAPTTKVKPGAVVEVELWDNGCFVGEETRITYNPSKGCPLPKITGVPRFLALNDGLGKAILGKQVSGEHISYKGKDDRNMRARIVNVE